MTNLSIFDRNVLHSFQGIADSADAFGAAESAYLRGLDRCRAKAERAGREAASLVNQCKPLIEMACRPFASKAASTTVNDVMRFTLERSYRRYFPDGRTA